MIKDEIFEYITLCVIYKHTNDMSPQITKSAFEKEKLLFESAIEFLEKFNKENEQHIKLFKEQKEHCNELELINQKVMEEKERLETDLEYAKAIIKDLLNNSHEYSKQNAEDFVKGDNK